MTGKALSILAGVVLVGAAIATYFLAGWPTALEDGDAARAVVEEFGAKMQNVNILGDKTMAADAIAREYGPLITPTLLSLWQQDPTLAPGRITSSPWPDHIQITSLERENRSKYVIEGDIVEVSNEAGLAETKEAVRRPSVFTVEKDGGAWKISEVVLGAYPGEASWISSTPGDKDFIFLYPERIPTTFISAAEWPPLVERVVNRYMCKEGPITAADGPQKTTQKHMVGDREYCVTESSEGAAGSTYRTFEYNFQFGGEPYRTVFTLRYPQCENYDEPQRSACKAEQGSYSVDELVDRIAQSIQKIPEK